MRKITISVLTVIALVLFSAAASYCQGRTVTARDCVQVRYITGVWMSHDGTRIAYLVKSPNIADNRNDYQLYVRDVTDGKFDIGKLLITGPDISGVQWVGDDTRLAMLESIDGTKQLVFLNSFTGKRTRSFEVPVGIDSYTLDSSGATVAYSVPDAPAQHELSGPTRDEKNSGYLVTFGEKATDGVPTSTLFIRHQDRMAKWSAPQSVVAQNPFTLVKTTHLVYVRNLSLSPDGKLLFLTYLTDGVPSDWMKDPSVRELVNLNSLNEVMILYDLEKKTSGLAYKSLICYSKPLWSKDNRSFFLTAHSPVGSSWEADDIRDNLTSSSNVNLFQVEIASGNITEVMRRVPPWSYHDGPLFLKPDGDLIVRTENTTVTHYRRVGDSWQERSKLTLPQHPEDRFNYLASNGTMILGTHETVKMAPELFGFSGEAKQIRILTDINPELSQVRFAPVQTINWMSSEGLSVSGLLFMPPDYLPGRRYPLVIQTKGDQGFFTCDSGANHSPSVAPQPIASSGIMYLIRTVPENWNQLEEVRMRPKGYPGGISEAVQQMDIWDSAVDLLAQKGMVDPARVGIIGFSRTGWEVEFDLVHAHTKFAAATATDNAQYGLSEYWLVPSAVRDEETMYGGPPFGNTLDNWEKYSISFNLDKVHTPLLLEEMGHGVQNDVQGAIPINLALRLEVTTGLTRRGKPVEMYYYPNDTHQPDHPMARLGTVQRNVDWYRFWLQGYEDRDPSKEQQYVRWRALKHLRDQDRDFQNKVSTDNTGFK